MRSIDDESRLADMLDAAKRAYGIVQGRQRCDLDTDALLRPALERLVEIVGEAAAHVSKSRQDRLNQIPWAQIIAMRNRLIHGYMTINSDVLWATVREDLPHLITVLTRELEEGAGNSDGGPA